MIREGRFELYSKGIKGKEATRAGPGDVRHVVSRGLTVSRMSVIRWGGRS